MVEVFCEGLPLDAEKRFDTIMSKAIRRGNAYREAPSADDVASIRAEAHSLAINKHCN